MISAFCTCKYFHIQKKLSNQSEGESGDILDLPCSVRQEKSFLLSVFCNF